MRESDEFVTYLVERFQGEVYGEAVFKAMADAEQDPEARWKWRVLETLERETKEYLDAALRARGHEAKPSEESWAQGLRFGKRLASVPRAVFLPGLRGEVLKFVAEYEAAEALAPADGRVIAQHVTAHERAILDFADLELAGRGHESAAPVLALLANPPAR
jgi:hypothetical protein